MEGFKFEGVFHHGREVIVTVRHSHLFVHQQKESIEHPLLSAVYFLFSLGFQ